MRDDADARASAEDVRSASAVTPAAHDYDVHVHVRSGDIFAVHDQTHYAPARAHHARQADDGPPTGAACGSSPRTTATPSSARFLRRRRPRGLGQARRRARTGGRNQEPAENRLRPRARSCRRSSCSIRASSTTSASTTLRPAWGVPGLHARPHNLMPTRARTPQPEWPQGESSGPCSRGVRRGSSYVLLAVWPECGKRGSAESSTRPSAPCDGGDAGASVAGMLFGGARTRYTGCSAPRSQDYFRA